jgi:hypothetical protein
VGCGRSERGRARVGGGERGVSEPGRLGKLGQKRRRNPNSKNKMPFLFFFKQTAPKFLFEQENSFLGFGAKIKVAQNLILYNIALGYILKFQLDFEIGI